MVWLRPKIEHDLGFGERCEPSRLWENSRRYVLKDTGRATSCEK